MAMYYLAHDGEVSGPYAEGRLIAMEDQGEFGPSDQLAIAGTEDWLPVVDVLAPIRMEIEEREALEKERATSQRNHPAQRKKKRSLILFLSSLILLLLGLGLAIGSIFTADLFGIAVSLVVILLAVAIDRPRWICGKCGNRIEKTSNQCPACGVPLARK